jgi:hypothetical protein
MTPAEKSDELIRKYYSIGAIEVKQCALMAVDEILKEQCKSSEYKDAKYQDERVKYWLETKQEIEKL